MPRLRTRPRKERKRVVKVQFHPRPKGKPKGNDCPYAFVDKLVRDVHKPLAAAKIAVVWLLDTKPDRDGHLLLGRCKKATDCDREFREYDLVIFLNAKAWKLLEPAQRAALVDHELCHATVATDKNGDELRDERDRLCYRTRRHDIEEFNGVVKRHGLWLGDIAAFVQAANANPLYAEQAKADAERDAAARPAPESTRA